MDPVSVAGSVAAALAMATRVSSALHEARQRVPGGSLVALYGVGTQFDGLQAVLQRLSSRLPEFQKQNEPYLEELSQTIQDSVATMEKLLPIVEREQRHPCHTQGGPPFHSNILKVRLELLRRNLHDQQAKISKVLRQGQEGADSLRDTASNEAVDVRASVKAIFRSRMSSIGGTFSERVSGAFRTNKHSKMPAKLETSGDANAVGMEVKSMAKTTGNIAEDITESHPLAMRDLGGKKDLPSRIELEQVAHATDTSILTQQRQHLRRIEACLVVLSAAGAGMLGFLAQHRDADPWTHLPITGIQATVLPTPPNCLPAALVASIAVTTLAMTSYHYLHRRDRYQDLTVFGYAGGGAVLGRLAGLDGTGVLLRVVPWFVLAAMVLSSMFSPRRVGDRRPQAEAGDVNMRKGDLGA